MAEQDSVLDQYVTGASTSPAAPKGLQQAARNVDSANKGTHPASASILDQYTTASGAESFLEGARNWYTGANMEGVSNGWDTGFMAEMFKQYDEQEALAAEAKDPTQIYSWFDRDDATGVALWDDEDRGIKRGDIFNGGPKKVGNVYEDFDETTANVMMAEFVLDSKTKQKIFADPDRDRWLKDEVSGQLDQNTAAAKTAKQSFEFAEGVEGRQAEMQEGIGDEVAVFLGGAGGGSLLGGGVASVIPGAGTAVGTAVGFVGGGVSALLNRDQITEQAARALEISSMANREYGGFQEFSTNLKEFGGLGMRFISPVSNAVQGSYDAVQGKGGDGESEFYAMSEDGTRKAPTWLRVADVAATVADGAFQFGGKAGVSAYLASTGASVTGGIGMATTTGAGWDDRTASFNEYEGAKENLAAAGSIGIDAVQMGFGAAIAKAGVASRAAFATQGAHRAEGRISQAMTGARERLMPWTKTEDGVRRVELQGMSFKVAKDSRGVETAISARPTWTIVAPSEAIRWVPTSWRARNRAAMTQGAAGPDDYYQAALEMAGGSRVGQALVNGWAESTEEGIQAILEPVSFDADIDGMSVIEQAAYGMAGGVGMSLGNIAAPPARDDVARYRANLLHEMRHQGQSMTDEQWDALSPDQRKLAAMGDPEENLAIAAAMKTMSEAQRIQLGKTSMIGTAAATDMVTAAFTRDTASANRNLDGVVVMGGMTGDKAYAVDAAGNKFIDDDVMDANAAVGSMWQILNTITNQNAGIEAQLNDLDRRLADAAEEVATASPERQAELQALVQELTAEGDMAQNTARVGANIRRELMYLYEMYTEASRRGNVVDAEAAIDEFNGYIKDAVNGTLVDEAGARLQGADVEAARRAVEVMYTRHPIIEGGSFVILVPQASKALTRANAHGQVLTHQSTIKAMGADRDGDTMVSQAFVVPRDRNRDLLRAGAQYISRTPSTEVVGVDAQGNAITKQTEKIEVVTDAPDNEKYMVGLLAEGINDTQGSVTNNAATSAITALQLDLSTRYAPYVDNTVLQSALNTFADQVKDGDADARINLANTLFAAAPDRMVQAGIDHKTLELPWMMQRISLEWARYQQVYAAEDPANDYTPSMKEAPLPQEQAYGRAVALEETSNDGHTMSMLTAGVSPVREGQKFHYSVYRALIAAERNPGFLEHGFADMVATYAQIGSDMGQSERAAMLGRNAIQKRVSLWLEQIAEEEKDNMRGVPPSEARLLLANTMVSDIHLTGAGVYEVTGDKISLLQLLLKRSIEIERVQQRTTLESDPDAQRKLNRLERLTRMDLDDKNRSTTAQLAFLEVYGNTPLHALLGDSAKYLGAQLTPNQLLAQLTKRHEDGKSKQIYRWRRKAPYLMHWSTGNPPYTVDEVSSGNLSSYRVLVDALAAAARTDPRERKARNDNVHQQFTDGIDNLHTLMGAFRRKNSIKETADPRQVLEAMLEANPSYADTLAALIPEAARRGAIQVVNNQAYVATWVMDMLVQNPEQAAVTYRVQSWLAEWNALEGETEGKGDKQIRRPYSAVKSRMLQTFYALAAEPDGYELDRLILAMNNATSLDALMEQINNEPAWRGDRTELLPFFDDVADYEPNPADIWSAAMPGSVQREAIASFSQRTKMLTKSMVAVEQELETERVVLSAVRAFVDSGTDRDGGREYHEKLKLALSERFNFPDHIGPAARDRLTRAIQQGVIRMHDKGKADRNVAAFGEQLITVDEFGVKKSEFQSVDAMTSHDVDDILTNPTKLVEGPVRVGLEDGSYVIVDLSTVEGVLDALEHPGTNAFAKMVLFPTARDIGTTDNLQMWTDGKGLGLKTQLDNAGHRDVFVSADQQLTPAQAHKYISTLESGVRKRAMGKSDTEQAKAFFPIQNIINEFIVAYSHQLFAKPGDDEKVRNQIYVDVAQGIQAMAVLHRAGGDLTDQVTSILQESLRARHSRDGSTLRALLDNNFSSAAEDVMVLDAHRAAFVRRAAELQGLASDPSLTPEERATSQEELDFLREKLEEMVDNIGQLSSSNVVDSAINMFSFSGNPSGDMARKGQILRFLGTANRKDRFQGPYALLDRLNTVLAVDGFNLSNPEEFKPEEWDQLGAWASSIYLSELSGRTASSMEITPLVLGAEGEQVRRFYDPSWSYLVDGFMNDIVLDVAVKMAEKARYSPDATPAAVAGLLERTLFNEKKLGRWSELIPAKSLQARQVLSSASVGLAIPVGGELPKEVAVYVGAGRPTYKLPEAKQQTLRVKPVDASGAIVWDTDDALKLNNGFAGRVTMVGTNPDGTEFRKELLGEVGRAWMGEESVTNSPYKLIALDRITKAVADVHDNQYFATMTVEVEYFDTDSKPFDRAWANNIYFEGVGREGETQLTIGLTGTQTFGVNALSKQAQQEPLNQATKGGTGYKPTPIPPLSTVMGLETSNLVAEVLKAKALHLQHKEYDTGPAHPADLRSFYKMMKFRHLVVGTDANGETAAMWSEQAISIQDQNPAATLGSPDFPLANAKLVTLSDSQAQTLLGEPGTKGMPGVVNKPVLNLQDVDIFPELTPERLRAVGLTRLGEETALRDSGKRGFAGLNPHGLLSWSSDYGRVGATRYEADIIRMKEKQATVRYSRMSNQNFDPSSISDANARALAKMLDAESLAPLFARLNIPWTDIKDLQELQLTKALAQKVRALSEVDPSNVIWQHVQGASSNPAQGILTEIDTKDEFAKSPTFAMPTMGDVVVLDLQSFRNAAQGDEQLAYDTAREVLRAYTRTGATVVLGGAAVSTLRGDLAAELNTGVYGYERMAESSHFFGPIDPARMISQTRRAMESALTSTRQFNGNSLILTMVSDYFGDSSSENSSFWDLRPEQPVWRGEALTLLPTQVSDRYGQPVKGLGQYDQLATVRSQVIELLGTPEGRAHLHAIGGDPEGVPIYSNDGVTETPGIRSLDDAMDRLVDIMNTGGYPIEKDREIMMGDLIPLIGTDGSLLFARVGFQLPDWTALEEQLATPINPADPVKMGGKVGMAPAKLQAAWTVRPPGIIQEVNPDPMAGASVRVKYDLSRYGKGIAEGDGWKTLYGPLPNDIAAPDEALGANGLRINAFTGKKARMSKEATEGQVTNFGWAFALAGIDFRQEMVEFMLGKKARTADEMANDWAKVDTFLQELSRVDHGFTASELADHMNTGHFMALATAQINQSADKAFGAGFVVPGTNAPYPSTQTANERLGQLIMMSVMAPRVRVEDVISTSGLMNLENLNGEPTVTLMPKIFTDALEDFHFPELRTYLFDKINAQFPRRADGTRPYVLQPDWTLMTQMKNPQTGATLNVPATLQISLEFAADENPVNYVQSAVRNARQGVSQHVAFVTAEAIGARTVTEKELAQVNQLFADTDITRFDDQADGGFWQMMRAVPPAGKDKSWKPWSRALPMQRLHIQEAHTRVLSYLEPIPKEDPSAWTAYDAVVNQILTEMIGQKEGEKYRVEIDYMVRMMFGQPGRRAGQTDDFAEVTPAVAKQAAEMILTNIRKGRIPTYGGVVPLWHEAFAASVFEENLVRGADAWAPTLGEKVLAKNFDDWFKVSVGQMRESESLVDTTFRMDIDGFWHTWQNATAETGTMAISTDALIDLKLMDKATNEAVASLDPNQEYILSTPVVFDSMRATHASIVGHDASFKEGAMRTTPNSELSKRIEKHVAWHAGKKMPKQEKLTYRKYLEEGSWYIQSSRDTHTFFHNIVNLSVGMRLLNPALWTSAVIEVGVRQTMEYMTNAAMGESTSRGLGKLTAKMGANVRTPEQVDKLRKLNQTMGADNRFLKVIYDELTYKNLVETGRGRLGEGIESFAKFSARVSSDPKFGMLASAVAARYNEAALSYLERTDNAVPFDVYVAQMNRDPMWLRDNTQQGDPLDKSTTIFNPHQAGLNRVAQVRSMKQTVIGKTMMGLIDLPGRHENWTVNATAHLLKIPFLFTRFNMNALTTIMGLGGLDQMAAMMLDQRQSPFLGRTKAFLSGRQYDESMDAIQMGDVLEGVDLVRPFVRGAITHTGLMAAGLMAGSLGFSGEDEETKRRRRLSNWLNTPYIYDPRRTENEWLYADSMFLDWLPEWLPGANMFDVAVDEEGNVRSAAQPHWIVRQFLSPVIGIERFLNTGDPAQIKYGFSDAFSAIPNSVARLWNEATVTADMLLEEAKTQDGLTTPEAIGNGTQLFINIVGVYERALLENSFVNSVRMAADEYNRNPWIIPETTKTGEIVRDPNTGLPVAGNVQQTIIDPETGEVTKTYGSRSDLSARMHQYAETNLTAATLMSLFTGQWSQDSTYFRKNMVPSQKTVFKPELEQAQSEAILMAALEGQARRGEGYDNITPYEIELTLREQAKATGEWVDWSDIKVQAQKIWDAKYSGTAAKTGGFELVDKRSASLLESGNLDLVNEETGELSVVGSRGVLDALRSGNVELGDESLIGLSISVPARQAIQEEWTEELITDGMKLGLNEEAAKARARRIWYGNTFEDPNATGLKHLLWDDRIPWNTKVTYNQLNVTFMMGPEGRPWATPFTRGNLAQALGIPLPSRAWTSRGGLTKDIRGNTVDAAYGLNTGLKGLERVEEHGELPVPEDDPAAFGKSFAPSDSAIGDFDGGGKKSGWVNFGKRGYTPYKRRSYGGYGGGAPTEYPNFTKMYALPNVNTPYGNDIPFINTSNPILRRADVRRERVWSERGRLNQWQ